MANFRLAKNEWALGKADIAYARATSARGVLAGSFGPDYLSVRKITEWIAEKYPS
jgi:hypothetical protein